MSPMLTQQQRAFYDTFGYLHFRQYFGPDEMAEISRLFDVVIEEARAGKPFEGQKRQMVLGCIEKRPGLARLVDDDRIYGVVEDLLGPDFVWITSDGNLYVGDTQWHPDAGGRLLGYHLVKIAFYLDPVGRDSGCLRVIPGSHHEPFHSALKPLAQHRADPPVYPFGVTGDRIPAVALESAPGDVVLFNQALYHASFGGSNHRRMFTLNFTERATRPEHAALHRSLYDGHMQYQRTNAWRPLDYLYEPDFLRGGDARHQSMVRQLVEWGFR